MPMSNQKVRPRREWAKEAACTDLDLSTSADIFHLEKSVGRPTREQQFVQFCSDCPVKFECLSFGIVHDYYGVWGGTTRGQRKKIPSEIRESMKRQAHEDGWWEPVLPELTEGVPLDNEEWSPTPKYYRRNDRENPGVVVELGPTTLEFRIEVLEFRLTGIDPTPRNQVLSQIEFPEVVEDFSIVSGL